MLRFSEEYSILLDENAKLSFLKKLRLKLDYHIKKFNFYGTEADSIISYCQNEYYIRRLDEINARLNKIEKILNAYSFDSNMKSYSETSMQLFKSALGKKYA